MRIQAAWMLSGCCGFLAAWGGACTSGAGGERGAPASTRAVEMSASGEATPRQQIAARDAGGRGDGRSVALVGEAPVALGDLAAQMAELSGGVALREWALDAALERELAAVNMRVAPAEAARERELLLANLAEESRVSSDQAERLLERVRANRGLGPVRFGELLSRNAKLRALVRDDVVITPELLDREVTLQTTPRSQIRLLFTSNQRDAASARDRVMGAPSGLRSAAFAEQAMVQSTDASAAAGGLVPPIHASDPAVPGAIRSALTTLRPGDVSDVLAVEGGFALVLLEGNAPAAMSGDGASRAAIERRLRGRLERLAMDALAERLVRESNVRVLDGSLGWSWENAR